MPTLPPPKMPSRPSDAFHISLLILCAVGFLVLYFKVDLDGSLNASYIANVSQQVERVERRMMMAEKNMILPEKSAKADVQDKRVSFPQLGLAFTAPATLGEKKFTEHKSFCFGEDDKKCIGSAFDVMVGDKIKICGASEEFTAPRGGYYCDEYNPVVQKNGKFYFTSRFTRKEVAINPSKVVAIKNGKAFIFSKADLAGIDPYGMSGFPEIIAVIPLQGKTYKVAWFDLSKLNEQERDAIIASTEVSPPTLSGAELQKTRISELEKIQQKIQQKQPKAKYRLIAVDESLTISSGDEVCINSGGPAPLQPKGSCGFIITVQPLDKLDRSYLPDGGMTTEKPTKYAEVTERPALMDGPGAAGEFTAHFGETEYRISVFDSTEGSRVGVLDRDQVLDAVLQAFKK